jgi:hypothetical protein
MNIRTEHFYVPSSTMVTAWKSCVMSHSINNVSPHYTLCRRTESETETGSILVHWVDISASYGLCNGDDCAELRAEAGKVHDEGYVPYLFITSPNERVCVFASAAQMATYVEALHPSERSVKALQASRA